MAAAEDRDILPNIIKPKNYEISIYDVELGGSFRFKGTVKIDIQVHSSTNEVVLNSQEIKIHDAKLFSGHMKTQEPLKSSSITYDVKSQRATLVFPTELPTSEYTLVINYAGTVNNTMSGFYRSKYKPAVTPAASVPEVDGHHYMFSTQFESCDARQAFPCFDEPNLKTTFDVEIEIPEDQTALSNMPEKDVKKSKRDGFKVVAFEKTPVMSTYLLAWAFGDFEYVEDFTKRKYDGKNLPVRVYTTRGLKEQGRLALQTAHQVIDYFSEIFKIDYPLPKADLLAVHEFSHGAMEKYNSTKHRTMFVADIESSWGLLTYRMVVILYDEQRSDTRFKNRVAYVVSHELAHQWFGNLVTMDWWSELWLNEGFATWVGWVAVDHLYPEWNVWAQFIAEASQMAFQLDSIRGSHAIEVPVKDALDIDQIFDHISYLKGSSVIRMLSNYLGVETFLTGVSSYLKKHEYGNATTADLWAALSEASGQDVPAFMDNWIRKIGFPVLTVAEEPGQISIKQSRLLSTGDVKPEEDTTVWWIPLGLKTDLKSPAKASVLTSKEETIRDISDEFYKLNSDHTGFYRTNYPPGRLIKLGKMQEQLSIDDKIGLIGDAGALAQAGESTTPGLLAFLENFGSEQSYLVWSQIMSSLSSIRSIFSEKPDIAKGLKAFTLKLVTPAANKIGWKFSPEDDYLTVQLRVLLLGTAGRAGHEGIIDEAQRQFKSYFAGDKKAINQNMRSAVFRICIAEGDVHEYHAVQQEYFNTTSVDGKDICLMAMCTIQTHDIASEYLDFLFSPQVAPQDMHTGGSGLAANSKTRRTLWSYIKSNWKAVHGKLSGNPVVLDRFLRLSLSNFSTFEIEKDIASFFKDKDNRGYDRSLGVISDTVRGNAAYLERDEKTLRKWLTVYGYMR